jgi:hypothetical protein
LTKRLPGAVRLHDGAAPSIFMRKGAISSEVLEGKNNVKCEIRPNGHPRLMLYIAIQCRGTPFRDKVWSHKANSGRLDADL